MLPLAAAFLAPSAAFAQATVVAYSDSLEVASLVFNGLDSFAETEVLTRISTGETPGTLPAWLYTNFGARFPLASEPRYFDHDAFLRDVDVIQRFYKNNGFFEARVTASYEVDQDEQQVDAEFRIIEGPASYIDSVVHKGIQRLPEDLKEQVVDNAVLSPGKRYSAELVYQEKQRIMSLLLNNGFPRVSIDSIVVERKLSNNNVLVRIPLRHGRRMYFGEITEDIKGVDELNLSRQIVYDRLDFLSGDVYSLEEQNQGETNLNRLGVFSYARLVPTYPAIDDEDSLVPLRLEMIVQKRYELTYGAIASDQLRKLSLGAETSFRMRNVFGGAQSLTAKLSLIGAIPEVTETYKGAAQLRFDQPYLISNRNSGYIAGSYSLVGERGLATGDIFQVTLGVQRFFRQRTLGKIEWTYEISEFNGDPKALLGAGLIYIDTTETINYRNSIIAFSLEQDMTDDLFNPSTGWFGKGVFETAGLMEKIGLSPLPLADWDNGIATTEYFKLEALFKYFNDISRNRSNIFGAKLRAGSIFRTGSSKALNLPVPPNRRYYGGGPNSIRGWNIRELAVDSNAVNFGSNTLIESSAELRWHLFPYEKNWTNAMWFVAFVDAGNLWNELRDVTFDKVAVAMGAGLRYNTMFGPFRVDFGMKARDPSRAENKWFFERRFWSEIFLGGVVQLSIGHAF